jgi:hypothetical protein
MIPKLTIIESSGNVTGCWLHFQNDQDIDGIMSLQIGRKKAEVIFVISILITIIFNI